MLDIDSWLGCIDAGSNYNIVDWWQGVSLLMFVPTTTTQAIAIPMHAFKCRLWIRGYRSLTSGLCNRPCYVESPCRLLVFNSTTDQHI